MAKVAIVTGASGNLGQAVVKRFSAEGYTVIGTVVSNDPSVNNPEFQREFVNLINEDDAQLFVTKVISNYGAIDAAILTVGGFAMGKIAETKTVDLMQQYKLNFETAYNIARPVFGQMMQQGHGRIFIIGSKPGLDARFGKGMIAYGLSKSLLFRLAELMNEEAKGRDVVTSVVVPSIIDTPKNRKSMPDSNAENWVKPEAIADIISFYCSPAASVLREPVIKVYNNA